MEPEEAYVRLFEDKNFKKNELRIPYTLGPYVSIALEHSIHDSCSSFILVAPPRVTLRLCDHHRHEDSNYPGTTYQWPGTGGELRVDQENDGEVQGLRSVGLKDEVSSLVWLLDGQPYGNQTAWAGVPEGMSLFCATTATDIRFTFYAKNLQLAKIKAMTMAASNSPVVRVDEGQCKF